MKVDFQFSNDDKDKDVRIVFIAEDEAEREMLELLHDTELCTTDHFPKQNILVAEFK